MNKQALMIAVCAASLTVGCVKDIPSEERLERETTRSSAGSSATAEELLKLRCDDTAPALAKARNESSPEDDRLEAYMDLYDSVKERSKKFEDAMSRNPDLAYQEGSAEVVAARDTCIQASADTKVEMEILVRELVRVPTVQEIKSGATVTVARLDFDVLKKAIEKLEFDDSDALLSQVANAEKRIEAAGTAKPKRGRRNGK